MAQSIQVIPSRVHMHTSGNRASVYGAVPWRSSAEREEWSTVINGYTWEVVDTQGRVTVGLCRMPAETLKEALEVAERWVNVSPEYRVALKPRLPA